MPANPGSWTRSTEEAQVRPFRLEEILDNAAISNVKLKLVEGGEASIELLRWRMKRCPHAVFWCGKRLGRTGPAFISMFRPSH